MHERGPAVKAGRGGWSTNGLFVQLRYHKGPFAFALSNVLCVHLIIIVSYGNEFSNGVLPDQTLH